VTRRERRRRGRAIRLGFIDAEQLAKLAAKLPNDYGQYLKNVIHDPYAVGE
jgi:hypothetical protein